MKRYFVGNILHIDVPGLGLKASFPIHTVILGESDACYFLWEGRRNMILDILGNIEIVDIFSPFIRLTSDEIMFVAKIKEENDISYQEYSGVCTLLGAPPRDDVLEVGDIVKVECKNLNSCVETRIKGVKYGEISVVYYIWDEAMSPNQYFQLSEAQVTAFDSGNTVLSLSDEGDDFSAVCTIEKMVKVVQ